MAESDADAAAVVALGADADVGVVGWDVGEPADDVAVGSGAAILDGVAEEETVAVVCVGEEWIPELAVPHSI